MLGIANTFYKKIRPKLMAGNQDEVIQNEESVVKAGFSQLAMELESNRYSHKSIMGEYTKGLFSLLEKVKQTIDFKNVLDVGTADGEIISFVANRYSDCKFLSVDLMSDFIILAKKKFSHIKNITFEQQNFLSDSKGGYDLVMCLQTLEHIWDSEIEEFFNKLFEKSNHAVLLSVPREPNWCLANMARLKYLGRLGNTFHHVQHWTKKSFVNKVTQVAEKKWGSKFKLISISPLFLWTIVLVVKNKE
jgi:2-polyprenyl-3-methyl-5-hydroxy-6-metoxy-1,4-benzoquinol methylase